MDIEKIYNDINQWLSLSIKDLYYYRNLIIKILWYKNKDYIDIRESYIYLAHPVNIDSVDRFKKVGVRGEFYFYYTKTFYKVSSELITVEEIYNFILLERRIKIERLKKLIHAY